MNKGIKVRKISAVIISAIALAMSTGFAHALRGDHSEGQGGGGIKIEYYHADPLSRTTGNSNVAYDCLVQTWVPQSLTCRGSDANEQFVDFSNDCRVIPGHMQDSMGTCYKDESVVELYCKAGGTLEYVSSYFDKKLKYRRVNPKKQMCRYKYVPASEPDRGNYGNRM